MTSLSRERYWPYLTALLVGAAWFYIGSPFPHNSDPLMGASGTVAAVLVGFLGTAKAIVLSVSTSDVFKRLKESGYSNVLFIYLFEALSTGIVFLVISMLGFFLPEHEPHPWFSLIWVCAGSAAILLYSRTTILLFKLVRQA